MAGDSRNLDYLPWRAPEVDDSRHLRPQDVESARKLAWEQGYEDGYGIGMEAGTRDARQRIKQLNEILETLAKPFQDLDDAVANQFVELVRNISQAVVKREITLDPGLLREIVVEAIAALPAADSQVTIVVHPDDAGLIEAHLESATVRSWRLEMNPMQDRGGCEVRTDIARIDANIGSRLSQLIDSMLEPEDQHADS